MSSQVGVSDEKILSLDNYGTSELYDDAEKAALAYADAITLSGDDVSDELFAEVAAHYDEDAVIELTAVIAWENASSKFNRALRIGSQNLWQRS